MKNTSTRLSCLAAIMAAVFAIAPVTADAWYAYYDDYYYDYGYDSYNYDNYDYYEPMNYGYTDYSYGYENAYPSYSQPYANDQYQYASYQFNSPYMYSYGGTPTGDYIPYVNEPLCNYPGYGRYSCNYHPGQPLYDYWTGTWY